MKIAREVVRHPHASMRCLQLRLPAFRGGLHRHAHAELTWIERGHGLRWVGDSVEPFGDGDLVLLGAELAHMWLTPEGSQPLRCAATVLQFPVNWAAGTGLPELMELDTLMARAAHGIAIEGSVRRKVQPLMARMAESDAPHRVAALIEVLAILHTSLAQRSAGLRMLSDHAPQPNADGVSRSQKHARVDQLLQWIQSHLAEDLRVNDAAEILGISPAAFARYFRREIGKSFIDFVNDARCSWAAVRLLQSQESIAGIAQACGFPSLSNFGEQFRRRYGSSPREYRRRALLR